MCSSAVSISLGGSGQSNTSTGQSLALASQAQVQAFQADDIVLAESELPERLGWLLAGLVCFGALTEWTGYVFGGGLVALFWLLGPAGTDGGPSGVARLVSIMGTVLPLALIWMAVGLARAIEELRTEAALLRARMDMLRGSEGEPERPNARPAAEPRPTTPLTLTRAEA